MYTYSSRDESLWALVNLIRGGTEEQARTLVRAGGAEAFVKELDDSFEKLTLQALNGLSALLQIPSLESEVKRIIRVSGGLEKLDALFHSDSLDLIDKASKILSNFLCDDLRDGRSEDDDEERQEGNGEETDGESKKDETQEGGETWQDKDAQKVEKGVDNQVETREDEKEEEKENGHNGAEESNTEEENKKENIGVMQKENADLEGREEQHLDDKNLHIPEEQEADGENGLENEEIKKINIMEDGENAQEVKEDNEGMVKMGDSDELYKEKDKILDEADSRTKNKDLNNTDGNNENTDNETDTMNNAAAVEPTLLDDE
ncbi:myb-like protein X [Penaeus chinensis]|uniref:myb-like protein X n=1 Tax=Penaeus chinensis TaxID=139456 RepID=UPI001FB78B45|nr:myb-like protein X [Penaeus chinensis]